MKLNIPLGTEREKEKWLPRLNLQAKKRDYSRRDFLAMLHSRWGSRYKPLLAGGRATRERHLPCYYCGNMTGSNDYAPGLEFFNKLGPLEAARKKVNPVTVPSCRSCSTHLANGASGITEPEERKEFLRTKFDKIGKSQDVDMRLRKNSGAYNSVIEAMSQIFKKREPR